MEAITTTGNWLFDALATGFPSDLMQPFASVDGVEVSYQSLIGQSAQVAATLVWLGVKPGDRVAAQVDKSLSALSLYLGTVRAGAIFLPMNTAYTKDEVAYLLGDAAPTLFVCDPARAGHLREATSAAGASMMTMDANGKGDLITLAMARKDDFIAVPRAADDVAAMLYTSGTTGRPKGAMLTHNNLASNAKALVKTWRFTSSDVLIHALPIFHTHGLFVATHCVLMSGSTMHFLPKFDAKAIVSLMPQSTVLMGVPTFYTRLLAEPSLPEACKTMRLFVSGSAPLLADTHQQFCAATGHAILERYGMTETNMNTSNPYDGARRPGTVGLPLPGVEVRITDPDAEAGTVRVFDQGTVGMIEVRGPNVFKGYWQMPEKTAAEKRDDGFFITGDLGLIDDQGYVQIVGRGKDLIISGGFNVYPKEVETLIDEIETVFESAVVGVPHADFGEAVVAVVVPREGASVGAGDVLDAVKHKLARYKQPKQVVIVDALPRNTMGKVQKALLREGFKDIFSAQ